MPTQKSTKRAKAPAPISRLPERPQAIELFAGAGGLGLGVTQAGFTPLKVVEWDRWCCDTLRENRRRRASWMMHWPDPVQTDVRAINFGIYEGKVDLVTGGPPCQPFSLGGKHKGFDDERDMWPEAVRAVRETRPKAFIFENVKGLTRAAFATYLAYIHLQLRFPEQGRRVDEDWQEHLGRLEKHQTSRSKSDLRYRVVFRVLNAADYGVPQKRERIVFVGFRSDLDIEWSFPSATHSLDALLWSQVRTGEYWDRHEVRKRDRVVDERLVARSSQLLRPSMEAWKTTRDAIGDLPDPEFDPKAAADIRDHRYQAGARSYPGHTGSLLDMPAKTLKAGVHGVPGGENMLARPDGSVRYFTVRESARLQTFPDDFVFHGAWSEAMRQLGNAVPVALGAMVAKHVRRHLDANIRLKEMGL